MTDFTPAQVRVVNDADALKALGDPLRLRLLHLLMSEPRRTWSVKEVAAALDQPVTRLYHHVKQLEQARLVVDVESRLVSGIVEHRYQTAQRGLEFDDSLFGSPVTRDASIEQTASLLDTSRDELVRFLSRPDADIETSMLSKAYVRLTPDEVGQLTEQLHAIVAGFGAHKDDPARADLPHTSVLFVVHPTELASS